MFSFWMLFMFDGRQSRWERRWVEITNDSEVVWKLRNVRVVKVLREDFREGETEKDNGGWLERKNLVICSFEEILVRKSFKEHQVEFYWHLEVLQSRSSSVLVWMQKSLKSFDFNSNCCWKHGKSSLTVFTTKLSIAKAFSFVFKKSLNLEHDSTFKPPPSGPWRVINNW